MAVPPDGVIEADACTRSEPRRECVGGDGMCRKIEGDLHRVLPSDRSEGNALKARRMPGRANSRRGPRDSPRRSVVAVAEQVAAPGGAHRQASKSPRRRRSSFLRYRSAQRLLPAIGPIALGRRRCDDRVARLALLVHVATSGLCMCKRAVVLARPVRAHSTGLDAEISSRSVPLEDLVAGRPTRLAALIGLVQRACIEPVKPRRRPSQKKEKKKKKEKNPAGHVRAPCSQLGIG